MDATPVPGPVAELAATCGTDAPTYSRDRTGMSAFVLEDGAVYHTYSAFSRGVDAIWEACTRGSIARPTAAMKPASGGAATTSMGMASRHSPSGEHEGGIREQSWIANLRGLQLSPPRRCADFCDHGAVYRDPWWQHAGHAVLCHP